MEQKNNQEIDIRKIVRIVLEHWYWFAIGIVVCVALGLLRYFRTPVSMKTDASVVLHLQEMTGNKLDPLSLLGVSANSETDDEVVVMSSRGLMAQALEAQGLYETSFVKDKLRWREEYCTHAFSIECLELTRKAKTATFYVTVKPTRSGYKVRTKMGRWYWSSTRVKTLDEPIKTVVGTIRLHPHRELSRDSVYRAERMLPELKVAQYRQMMKITQHKKESNIINFVIKSALPDRDKALLYQLIEQYNLNAIVDKNMIASNTATFINERMNKIESELIESEKTVASYKKQNNIADIHAQAQLLLQANNAEQNAIVSIETQLQLVDYVDGFLRDESKRNSLIPVNIGITDASLETGLSEYNAILLQKMRIQRTATDSNPVIEQMDSQLATMRQNIIATIGSVRESLKIRLASLQAQDSKFNRQLKEAPETEREYVRVVRDQKIKEQLYLFLYEKREENALMLAATSMPAKIVNAPQLDALSAQPKLKNTIALGVFAGLAIPAIILYLLVFFNDKIDDEKEFERRIHAPLLGQLVENSRHARIAIREGESTVSAELFRLIRTNLRFVLPADVQSPVILVSSCINGEGKSYVSSNTALSLAMLGKRVVVVGLDIRKPMLADYFQLPNRGHLTSYLSDSSVTMDDIIMPSGEHKNLDVIPCGTIPPNPAELLQTERVDELFKQLRKRYDYIIVDTAPVAMVSDTYLLDRIADMTIFVCRYKYTPTEMVDYINRIVEQKRMHNVACVLNGIKGARAGYGYGVQND